MNNSSGPIPFFSTLAGRLFAPVDITFLAWFRVLFGAMLLWEVCLFFYYDLINRYFVERTFHLKYYGFGWVQPLSDNGMHLLFFVMGLLAVGVLIGLYGRVSAALFALAFSYVFLLEKARYMNHFYLMILLCGLLALMPCNCAWSVDALLRPRIRRSTTPAWTLWLLRFQLGVVYFFAGLAKLYPDWLDGRVITEMFAYKQHLPVVAQLGDERWFVLLMSYSALLFDLFVTPLLLWRRTRLAAILVAIAFHLSNTVLFHIDIFPWLMMGSTIILFADDWLPLRVNVPPDNTPGENTPPETSIWRQKALVGFLGIYTLVQVGMPLRHWLYPGDAAWTDEGQTFAWRMLMRVKLVQPPRFPVRCVVDGKLYQTAIPAPDDPDFWRSDWQASKILRDPDMVWQVVQDHAIRLRKRGAEQVDIRAIVPVSLNGYPPQLLIDPEVNLAEVPRSLWHKHWVTEFQRDTASSP